MAASPMLALHELTTDAIKFSTVGTPRGRIAVRRVIDSHEPGRIRLQ